MLVELADQTGGHPASVRPAVEREIVPAVRVAFLGPGREIRGVREQPVESTETAREVGADHREVEPFAAGPTAEPAQGVRIEVGRHHPGSPTGGGERGEPRPGPHFEDPGARRHLGERDEQERVLANRIDGARPVRRFRAAGRSGRERRARGMASYWLHAYN